MTTLMALVCGFLLGGIAGYALTIWGVACASVKRERE